MDVESKKLAYLSLVIISDCMTHDTVAVHLFQRLMIDFLKPVSYTHLDVYKRQPPYTILKKNQMLALRTLPYITITRGVFAFRTCM